MRRERIPDQGVDAGNVEIVQLLDGELDLPRVRSPMTEAQTNLVLVGAAVDNEDDGVVLLNLLEGGLRAMVGNGRKARRAAPVVRGCLTTVYASRALELTSDLRGYLGARTGRKVLGLRAMRYQDTAQRTDVTRASNKAHEPAEDDRGTDLAGTLGLGSLEGGLLGTLGLGSVLLLGGSCANERVQDTHTT